MSQQKNGVALLKKKKKNALRESDSEYSKAAVFRRLTYGGKPRPHTERDCFENVLFSGGGKLPLLLQRGGERKLAQRFIFFSLSLSRHRSVVRVALTLSCPSFTLHPLESTNSMRRWQNIYSYVQCHVFFFSKVIFTLLVQQAAL